LLLVAQSPRSLLPSGLVFDGNRNAQRGLAPLLEETTFI
jgi:hypothetical protein